MLGAITIVLTIVLLLLFYVERRSLLFGAVFLCWAMTLIVFIIITLEIYEQHIALIFALIVVAPVVVLFPFYFASFIILLISSGIQLIKKEGTKLRNFLSIALGVFFIVWAIVAPFFSVSKWTNPFWMAFYLLITFSVYYFIGLLLLFAVSSLLNRIPMPFKTYDYIIVLGSGLIGDKVPPLLASRIDKGIALFRRFHTDTHPVKVIFTGGQGSDEALAEGEAMAAYALEKGLEKEHIIIENKAVNTYENLLFSKRLIEADASVKEHSNTYHTITVTNNFHVFRALLWARKVKLKSDGAGAKTKFYFWLNALIREFIGVIYMQKKYHMSIILFGYFMITIFVLANIFLIGF
ncbi:YdcF family protein [Ornithinibacillus gellani]|uniref:YdcF family protein n=1 Tax=Ornithinibacillus gellani TaxID=2293253 RepID=UPI000F470932|nr:YdcF family protein [Ornithinibacillus gellani]TQS75602.1 YdcF family protein [Ornithinibacillus gellani]